MFGISYLLIIQISNALKRSYFFGKNRTNMHVDVCKLGEGYALMSFKLNYY